MKQIAYIIAFILVALTAIGARAEEINEISLTVSSDGSTKDDAVKNALRLAIEQAYGAFVSANTTILNDELVKDEIVTVTHGAIKDFKEMAQAQLPDNRYSVTLQATVSLPNLITYAKNHGSECEFAGDTFGMQMKLYEIEKENELKVLENLNTQLESIFPSVLSWGIEVETPRIVEDELPAIRERMLREGVQPSSHYEELAKKAALKVYINKFGQPDTLKNVYNKSLYDRLSNFYKGDCYKVTAKVNTQITSSLYSIFWNTINSIALNDLEREQYKKMGIRLTNVNKYELQPIHENDNKYLYFRNKDAIKIIRSIFDSFNKAACSFVIIDNLGNKHDLHLDEIYSWRKNAKDDGGWDQKYINFFTDNYKPNIYIESPKDFGVDRDDRISLKVRDIIGINEEETSFFSKPYDISKFSLDNIFAWIPGLNYEVVSPIQLCTVEFYIPKNQISKYSSFKVKRRE